MHFCYYNPKKIKKGIPTNLRLRAMGKGLSEIIMPH
jgi:hypothetical protein